MQVLQSLYDSQIYIAAYRTIKTADQKTEMFVPLQFSKSGVKLSKLLSISKRSVLFDLITLQNSCMSHVSNSLSSSSDCEEKEETVTFIQSIFRAHLARAVLLKER